jgi:hypothetical protein
MLINLYSIYDKVAETFNDPFKELNNASAIRSFQHSVIDQPHKDDYVIYHVGTFDTDKGEYNAIQPVRLLTGLEVQKPETPATLEKQAI